MRCSKKRLCPPPREVLDLVANYLPPESVAVASCVSKNWLDTFSSNGIWQPLCSSQYPNVFKLSFVDPTLSYHHLYGISHKAAKLMSPAKPCLALQDIVFIITAITKTGSPMFVVSQPCGDIELAADGSIFKFAVPVNCGFPLTKEVLKEMRTTCNVVSKGWKAIFNMMECVEGNVSSVPTVEGVFSKELPLPKYCPNFIASNIMAELKFEIGDDSNEGKLTVGIFNRRELRYVSVDDALRYLQEFLVA